jgi:hypothetical protein
MPWSSFLPDAPPTFVHFPYLYILFVVGKTAQLIGQSPASWTLLKYPAIVADGILALLVMRLAGQVAVTHGRPRHPIQRAAAAAIMLNPALIFVSAVWGQPDSVFATLVVGAFMLLTRKSQSALTETGALCLLWVAAANKPQIVVVLLIVYVVLVHRHLVPVWPRFGSVVRGAGRLAATTLPAAFLPLLLAAPFGLGLDGAFAYYTNLPSYEVTSAWAFNLWGIAGFWQPDRAPDTGVAGLSAFFVGAALFAAATLMLLVGLWRLFARGTKEKEILLFGTAAITALSFALLTRMHERYSYLVVPALAALAAHRWARRAMLGMSALLLLNVYFPYVFFVERYGQSTFLKLPVFDLIYGTDQDSFQKKALSFATMGACLLVAYRGAQVMGLLRWPAGQSSASDPLRLSAAITRRWQMFSNQAHSVGDLSKRNVAWRTAARSLSVPPTDDKSESREKTSAIWWQRFAPLLLVATACGFNLLVLNAEATPVHDLNDSSYHFAMLRWARTKIDQGKLPLDGWYPNLGLGLAQFHHYQSLPHVVGAYLSIIFGEALTFYWVLYLGLSLWPISVYLCARWLGWDRWTAGAAALVAPLLVSVSGYGYEDGSYTWRGYGTWSQLWGMWLLPLAWGLSWRAVKGVGSFALGALAVALTVAVHFLTGYLALLSIGVWALVAPSQLIPRFRRAIAVGVGAVLVGSWVIVPLVVDSPWASNTQSERGTIFYDSFGAPKILGWLISGQVFDYRRLPVVTVLGAVGLVVCLLRFRRDERARALLGVWLVSLLLFFGRPTLGPLLKILPGSDDLPLHRFINGVHLGGILLAGVGGAWLGGWLVGQARRRLPAVKPALAAVAICVVGVASLIPAWTQLATINQEGAGWIGQQVNADATDGADLSALVDKIYALGPGRVYAGSSANWGRDYRLGFVPVYAELANYDIDTVGFYLRTESLSADVETLFDESNPAQYDLFNIRYLILPQGKQPPVTATLIAQQGRHTLWTVASSGYMEVVDAVGAPIVADRKNIGGQTLAFARSPALAARLFPMVAFDGAPAAPNTITAASQLTGPAGTVVAEDSSPDEGTYAAEIEANRPAVVMLKTTFEPRWRVTVDGVEVPPQMIAPSFVARTVPAGRHSIEFRYVPFPAYPQLLALGLLTLAGLQFGPRLWRRFGGRLLIRLEKWAAEQGDGDGPPPPTGPA